MPGLLFIAFIVVALVLFIVVPIRIVILWRRGEYDHPTFESLTRLAESELLGPIGVLFALAALLFLAVFVSMLF